MLIEDKIITGIKLIKKGSNIGYGPTTEKTHKDLVEISFNNGLKTEKKHIELKDIKVIESYIKDSIKLEKNDIKSKESLLGIYFNDNKIKDYMLARKNKSNGVTENNFNQKYKKFDEILSEISVYLKSQIKPIKNKIN